MKYYLFKSKRIPWVAGNTENVQLDFLPTVGKDGGRMVIDRINVFFDINCTVLVTGAQNQLDFGSYIKQIRIFDAEGDRRLLTGRQAFLKAQLDIGIRLPPFSVNPGVGVPTYDFGAVVSGAADLTPNIVGSIPIFFTQPEHAHRDKDTALPVDDLLNGGGIELTMPAVGDLVGTTDFTSIDSGNYEIHVTCHQAHDMEYFSRDVVRSYYFPSSTEFMVPVSGKKLRELVAYREDTSWASATVGRLSPDFFTTVTCEAFNYQNVPCRLFSDAYLLEQPYLESDPVRVQRAIPIVFPGYDGKIPDMRRIGGLLFIQFGGAATACSFLVHTITPKSAAMAKAAAASNRLAVVDTEVRTKGKSSNRTSEKFKDDARFMPAKQRGGLAR